jgi:hypothetical protein
MVVVAAIRASDVYLEGRAASLALADPWNGELRWS